MKKEIHYFITVDWCNKGKRGLLCTKQGIGFWKKTQHTRNEMFRILGKFDIILYPKSEALTEEELKQYNKWMPLAEYENCGIATKG